MSHLWSHQRVLITGGTGFLGYHLAKQLGAMGAEVCIFALPAPADHPIFALPVTTFWGDIRDRDVVAQAANNCDVIFHTAGNVAVWGSGLQAMHDIHVTGTRNVIAVAARSARIIHTSSIVAVGATRYGAILHEESPFNLANLKIDYVQAKRAAEQVALHAAMTGRDMIVVNPGYLIGPEDHEPSVMGKFARRVWQGKMALAAPGGFNFVDVRDVARGHIQAAERGQPGRRYILGGDNCAMSEFIHRLLKQAAMKPRAIPCVPNPLMWLASGIAELRSMKTKREPYPSFQHVRLNQFKWFVTSDRARRELGYRPRPIEETISDMHDWFFRDREIHLRGLAKWWLRAA